MKKRLKEIIKKLSYEKREVTLASGRKSNFYFDGKQTTLNAEGAYLTGKLFYDIIKEENNIKAIGGPTMGADPIATSVAIVSYLEKSPLNAFIVRKEPKGHGKMLWIEGSKNLEKGSRVAIVEDVITTGGSILKAINIVEQEGYKVGLVVVLVDREEGGRENIEEKGYKFKSVFKKSEIVDD
jgi:orotate phosphoribosyltransferase